MTEKSLTLSAAEIASFPVGKGHCHTAGNVALIVFKAADGSLKVAPNTCMHLNQKLAPDVEDAGLMKCGMHNAKLDCSTMTYKSGPTFMTGMGKKVEEGTAHPQFTVALNADGSATLTPPAGFKAGGGCHVM